MDRNKKITVVVPAYNEEERIGQVIEAILFKITYKDLSLTTNT